jgi:F-type H+-transporting ATPase subunit epsilon
MNKKFHFSAYSLNETKFDATVNWVVVPGVMGEMTILPKHNPLITYLRKGKIMINKNEKTESFAVEGGVLEVTDSGQVKLLLK